MVFVKIQENASLYISFIFKPIQSPYVPLKNGTRDFQNSPPFKGPARFYHRVFELSSGKWKFFLKKLGYSFLVQSTANENTTFPSKTAYQKPILRQIDWVVQNGPIEKNGFLPLTASFFFKFNFRVKTSHK